MVRTFILSAFISLFVWTPQVSAAEWNGPYAGLAVGYKNSHVDVLGYQLEDDAAAGSLMLGYNYDLGSSVIGVEADVNALNYQDVDVGFYTLRGRFGFKVLENSGLAYLTAGYSNLEIEGFNFDGWTAGLGYEYSMSERIGIRTEYQYLRHDVYGTNVNTDSLRIGVTYKF